MVIELTAVPCGVFGTGPAGSGAATTLLLDQDTVHVTITAACERPPFRAGILFSLHRHVSYIHVHGHDFVYLGTS